MPKRAPEADIEEDVHFEEDLSSDDDISLADFTVKDEDEDYDEVKENNDSDYWEDY